MYWSVRVPGGSLSGAGKLYRHPVTCGADWRCRIRITLTQVECHSGIGDRQVSTLGYADSPGTWKLAHPFSLDSSVFASGDPAKQAGYTAMTPARIEVFRDSWQRSVGLAFAGHLEHR